MKEYGWEDLHLGLNSQFEATFTWEMVEAFAKISGDSNPLHLNGAYAKAAGYATPVLFGMMSSSLYSTLVGMYLPGKYGMLQGIDLHFNAPCHAGELLICKGEIVFLSDAFRRFEVKASIRKQDGKLVSKALIRVGFHG